MKRKNIIMKSVLLAFFCFVLIPDIYSQDVTLVPTTKSKSNSDQFTDESTTRMIDFVCNLRYEDLPESTIKRAKDLIANNLSCIALGAGEPEGGMIRQYSRNFNGDEENCTILGAIYKANTAMAAYANAAQAQIWDANDGSVGGETRNICAHPGRLIVPVAVACAESLGASGRDLITAVVAGYEFAGSAMNMPVSTRDLYVAAVVAGKLNDFDHAAMSQALLLAGYLSPGRNGLASPFADEYWISNGQIARSAVEAVMLIKNGFQTVDIRTVNTMPWTMDCDKLGNQWQILDTYIKPYPCCRNIHAAVDLALLLSKQNNLRGSEISRIDITKSKGFYVGKERLDATSTRTRAQFNIYHCVASAILFGKLDQRDFSKASIANAEVRKLSDKVFLYQKPKEKLSPGLPSGYTTMVITTNDGKRIEGALKHASGDPESPLSVEEMRKLCMDRFRILLSDKQSRRLYKAIQMLEGYDNITEFTKLLSVAK